MDSFEDLFVTRVSGESGTYLAYDESRADVRRSEVLAVMLDPRNKVPFVPSLAKLSTPDFNSALHFCQEKAKQKHLVIKARQEKAAFIFLYTFDNGKFEKSGREDNPFRILNSALFSGSDSDLEKVSGFLIGLFDAFSLLTYTKFNVLHRGLLRKVGWSPGDCKFWVTFTSMSLSEESACNFLSRDKANLACGTLIHAVGLWGYDISKYSSRPDEGEILLEPFQKVIVTKVSVPGNLADITVVDGGCKRLLEPERLPDNAAPVIHPVSTIKSVPDDGSIGSVPTIQHASDDTSSSSMTDSNPAVKPLGSKPSGGGRAIDDSEITESVTSPTSSVMGSPPMTSVHGVLAKPGWKDDPIMSRLMDAVNSYVLMDHRTPARIYEEMTKDKAPIAFYYLGICYLFGSGVTQDWKRAVQLWNKAGIIPRDELEEQLELCNARFICKGKLSIKDKGIGDDGAKGVAKLLSALTFFTEVNLSDNKIGNSGFKSLAEMIRVNNSLTSIDLSSNSVGMDGIKSLCLALQTNSTITELKLKKNKIGNKGAVFIAGMLKANNSLTSLSLNSVNFGPAGIESLAEGLKFNSTLTSIDLSRNDIGKDGTLSLSSLLKVNSSLIVLSLISSNIPEDIKHILTDIPRSELIFIFTHSDRNHLPAGSSMMASAAPEALDQPSSDIVSSDPESSEPAPSVSDPPVHKVASDSRPILCLSCKSHLIVNKEKMLCLMCLYGLFSDASHKQKQPKQKQKKRRPSFGSESSSSSDSSSSSSSESNDFVDSSLTATLHRLKTTIDKSCSSERHSGGTDSSQMPNKSSQSVMRAETTDKNGRRSRSNSKTRFAVVESESDSDSDDGNTETNAHGGVYEKKLFTADDSTVGRKRCLSRFNEKEMFCASDDDESTKRRGRTKSNEMAPPNFRARDFKPSAGFSPPTLPPTSPRSPKDPFCSPKMKPELVVVPPSPRGSKINPSLVIAPSSPRSPGTPLSRFCSSPRMNPGLTVDTSPPRSPRSPLYSPRGNVSSFVVPDFESANQKEKNNLAMLAPDEFVPKPLVSSSSKPIEHPKPVITDEFNPCSRCEKRNVVNKELDLCLKCLYDYVSSRKK